LSLTPKKIEAKIINILGVSDPFAQGGSFRLTIPKRMAKKYDLDKTVGKKYFGFIFVDTDKGVLLVSLEKAVNPDNIQNALNFMDTSNLTKEDLKTLFDEEE